MKSAEARVSLGLILGITPRCQCLFFVDKYVAEFKDRFGYVNCRQLKGLNLNTKEGLQEYYAKVHDYTCAERIKFAVEKALEILENKPTHFVFSDASMRLLLQTFLFLFLHFL